MKIDNSFQVPADPAAAFELLADLERVGECVPGGEVGGASEDGSHPVTVTVKLGPMKMSYAGTARMEDRDDAARTAVLTTEVREKRGQGSARAVMAMRVEPEGEGSRVFTETDLKLTGRAAQMGKGVVEDVAERLVGDMTDCIAKKLAPADGFELESGSGGRTPTESVGGIKLLLQVLWGRIKILWGSNQEAA